MAEENYSSLGIILVIRVAAFVARCFAEVAGQRAFDVDSHVGRICRVTLPTVTYPGFADEDRNLLRQSSFSVSFRRSECLYYEVIPNNISQHFLPASRRPCYISLTSGTVSS